MPAGGDQEVEALNSRMLERAPQVIAWISPRGRRGSQGHRAGKAWKMAPSAARVAAIASAACTRVSTRPSTLFRAEWNYGQDSRINKFLLAIAKLRYIHGAAAANTGYSSISAFGSRLGRLLIGWVGRFLVCCYYRTHISYTSFGPHASSSGEFRREHHRSSSTFYGDKRGVHQGFGSP